MCSAQSNMKRVKSYTGASNPTQDRMKWGWFALLVLMSLRRHQCDVFARIQTGPVLVDLRGHVFLISMWQHTHTHTQIKGQKNSPHLCSVPAVRSAGVTETKTQLCHFHTVQLYLSLPLSLTQNLSGSGSFASRPPSISNRRPVSFFPLPSSFGGRTMWETNISFLFKQIWPATPTRVRSSLAQSDWTETLCPNFLQVVFQQILLDGWTLRGRESYLREYRLGLLENLFDSVQKHFFFFFKSQMI